MKLMHYVPPARVFTVLMLLVLAVSVMSGGCGSSSSSSFSQSVNDTLNGAWSYDSGTVTATLSGISQELVVENFSVLFEGCNIEEDTGSARFAAVAVLQGEHFMMPMLFNKKTLTTTRNDAETWTADTEHGKFMIELLSDDKARLSGSMNWFESDKITADVDVIISKLPSTAPTIDINTALNGEWQSQAEVSGDGSTLEIKSGGGYRFHDGNIMPIGATFMNMTFSDTSIQAGTATLSGIAVEEVVDLSGEEPEYNTVYSVLDSKTAKVSHMFGDVYLISDVSPYPVIDISLTAILGNDKLSIISEGYTTYNGVVEENRGMFVLNRTTASKIASLDEFIGSSWESSMSVLDVYADDENATLLDINLASFDVSFPSADVENMKLTLTANAAVKTPDQEIFVDNRSAILSVKNVGYNILLGESAEGNLFSITLLTDKLAILTGDIGYTRDNWYDVDFLAIVQKVDEE